MYKKLLAICMAFILVISMAVVPVFADESQASILRQDKKDRDDDKIEKAMKKFFDSNEYDWAEEAIEKMGAMGIINGIGNGLFKPKNNVTHAEAIAMVLNFIGEQKKALAIKTQPAQFKGLSSSWSYGYLQVALDRGIIIPEEDGKFNANAVAKRYEIAKYIVRALGLRQEALQNMNARLGFSDANDIPDKAVGYVYVVAAKKIMLGSNNKFQPNKPVTRAEMAVLLSNVEKNIDTPVGNTSRTEGTVVARDTVNYKLTLVVNNRDVTYDVLPNAPVYHNSTYFTFSHLNKYDVVKVILDSQNKVIFIELKQAAPSAPVDGKLAIQTVQYENLPQALKDRVDNLKLSRTYAAFKFNQSLYLVAARGQMPTGGYTVEVKEVYRETIQTNRYNLRAVVKVVDPASNSVVTQAATYPYDVVRLDYFNGIEAVNFVNEANASLLLTNINTIDNVELISGRIYYVIEASRIIYVQESNSTLKAYEIPANAQITLAGQTTALSSLRKDMPVVITKVNNVIAGVAAQYEAPEIVTINGKVDSVDAANRIIRVLGSNNRYTNYTIPAGVQVTLNGSAIAWTALLEEMPIVITKTNNVITAVAVTDAIVNVTGKINVIDTTNRNLTILVNNTAYTYHIPENIPITINSQTAALSALVANMPVVITKTNGVVSRVAANNAVEAINGIIDSVNVAGRVISVKTNNNTVTPYLIGANVPVTLNNAQVTDLATLLKDMPIVITRTNGEISGVAVTNVVETKSGKIYAINISDRVIRVQDNSNTITAYNIPVEAAITLDSTVKTLADLTKNMNIVITRANGTVTAVAAQNVVENLEGVLVTTTVNQGKTFISVKVGNTFNVYEITASTSVLYNNQSIAMQNMPLNTTILIKILNGSVSEVKNK